jgi:hypothetical protein
MTRLASPPASLAATRSALHLLAAYVVSPWREARTERIGLRAVAGGFGTPPAGDPAERVWVGVEGLVVEGPEPSLHPVTTLRAAARAIGVDLDPTRSARFDVPAIGDIDAPLAVDSVAVSFLADWYAFGAAILTELLAGAGPADEPSEVQLWPEHFDIATEIGAGPTRTGYGASPGDAAHPVPYVFAAPWTAPAEGDSFWNEPHFRGRSLGYEELLSVSDPHRAATVFLAECRARTIADHGGRM